MPRSRYIKIRQDILSTFPKTSLSLLPTPLHKLENISSELSQSIYCKRDDLTGFAMGGNKTRKLDFLIADAKRKKADTLIAVGAVQSNFCRITAAAGKVNNLEVHLILGGRKPKVQTGNLLLSSLFGAQMHFVNSDNWLDWENNGKEIARRLSSKKKKVYFLPIGGSTEVGALGYVRAFFEILENSKQLGVHFDVIIHATSSGGTQAGLVVGKTITGWRGKIIGMAVAKNKKQLTNEIFELASKVGKLFGTKIDKSSIIVEDKFIGKGYAVRTEECESAIRLFAQKEGIVLDHVYTGKAVAGLIDYSERKIFKPNENILFLHTGGNVEIFE